MKRSLLFTSFALLFCLSDLTAQLADTTVIQTFTFGDVIKRKGTFLFPPAANSWRKVLMYYTLKCDPSTTEDQYPCGEWDRITYMVVYDSTGGVDSVIKQQPNYSIANTTPSVFPFRRTPTFTSYQRIKATLAVDTLRPGVVAVIGDSTLHLAHAFATTLPAGRSQYLWTAQELTQAGLAAGPIKSMSLFVSAPGALLRGFIVRMRSVAVNNFAQAVFVEDSLNVVFNDSLLVRAGENRLDFTTPFQWDGTSNVIIELAFTNSGGGTPVIFLGGAAPSGTGVWTAQNDACLHFTGDGMIQFADAKSLFSSTENEISIAFWACGDTIDIPNNPTVMLNAQDEDNARVLNVHLPWTDMGVYWDAGRVINDTWTSYNRLSKTAVQSNVEGRWNHWAFTKNAVSGSMKIFLNGQEWASTTKKWAPLERIVSFAIGSDVQMNTPIRWYGRLNDFYMWNKELSASDIQTIMYNDLPPAHPLRNNMILALPFNEGQGFVTTDQSASHANGFLAGAPAWTLVAGPELAKNAVLTAERPRIALFQNTSASHVDTTIYLAQEQNPVTNIVMYRDAGNPLRATDTLHVWKAGMSWLYDINQHVVDSVYVSPDSTLTAEYRNYKQLLAHVENYEFGRYITPYGKGLDLGANGFTWVYDVTDYAGLLHDNVTLSAGNQEELQDVKFVFFKGTPPMDVLSISKIVDLRSYGYGSLANNTAIPPDTLSTNAAAKLFRIKTRISGHGQAGTLDQANGLIYCCEWAEKNHYITVNTAAPLSWDPAANLDCGLNPAYPQGGNWAPTRGGGWCPGMPVGENDFDVSSLITPGAPTVVRYSIDSIPANNPGQAGGNYVISLHLFQCSAPHFVHDAELVEILSPSAADLYRRINPVCSMPLVRIRNNGSVELTSLVINYGMKGGIIRKFLWSGKLSFLQTGDVSLPMATADWATSDPAHIFTVSVEAPNGAADEYDVNNSAESVVAATDSYQNRLVFKLKNNAIPDDVSYTIRDAGGAILFQRDSMVINKSYLDTLSLADGCYSLDIITQEGLGLSTPMYAEVGNGYCQIMQFNANGSLSIMKMFASDFGRSLHYDFMAGIPLNVAKEILPAPRQLDVYPNPARTTFTLEYTGESASQLNVLIYDEQGRTVLKQQFSRSGGLLSKSFDVSSLPAGLYIIKAVDGKNRTTTTSFVKQ